MQVLKNSLAAVLGYAVMFAAAFVLFSLLWMVLGADGSFAPGVWDVSGAWIGGNIVLGIVVSMAGGFVCSKVAPSYQGVAILMGLVLVVGILQLMPEATVGGARPDGASMFDAMSSAQMPMWLMWINPVVGVVGVAFGAKLEGNFRAQ